MICCPCQKSKGRNVSYKTKIRVLAQNMNQKRSIWLVCGKGESIQCWAENHLFDHRLAKCAPTEGKAGNEFKFSWPAAFACIWRAKAGSFASLRVAWIGPITYNWKPSNFDQSWPDTSIRQQQIQFIYSEAISRRLYLLIQSTRLERSLHWNFSCCCSSQHKRHTTYGRLWGKKYINPQTWAS